MAAPVLPISEAQALAAIQGCWKAQRDTPVSTVACFKEGGVIETSDWLPNAHELLTWDGTYDFTHQRLRLWAEKVWSGWPWTSDENEATCSVTFASSKIFALHDCTAGMPDAQFRLMKSD